MRLTLSALALTMLAASSPAADLLPPRGKDVRALLALKVDDFATTMTTRIGEQQIREHELKELDRKLALPPGELADKELPGAMWTALLFNTRQEPVRQVLRRYLPTLHEKEVKFQQYFLYAAYELMPDEAAGVLMGLPLEKFEDREFAMIAYTRLKASANHPSAPVWREHIESIIKNHRQLPEAERVNGQLYAPRIQALLNEVQKPKSQWIASRPPLEDFLAHDFQSGTPVLFSLQRLNRKQPGLAVIRGADGRFVRNPDGTLFSLPQLANARTDMPGTITNGNTPQGVFTIVGTGTASNKWIGPTTYLYSQIPVEASVADFRHRAGSEEWTPEIYDSFLPESWRNYGPVKEAWLAGLAGRSEMLCHGTTINHEYYKGESYYPFTPSAGCLVTIEFRDPETGVPTRSDQLTLMQTFVRAGGPRGHLVVLEISADNEPVALSEVEGAIAAAEQQLESKAR